jgi:hypothetical protein
VSIGDKQTVVYIETVETSLGVKIVTSTEEEGETFGVIDDYDTDDIVSSTTQLALVVGAQDTGIGNGHDCTYTYTRIGWKNT